MGLSDIDSNLRYSHIKWKSVLDDGQGTIDENYKLISDIWEEHHMTLFTRSLEYINCEVGPFTTGLESFQEIFHGHSINVFFSNIISTLGLSRQLLFATSDS